MTIFYLDPVGGNDANDGTTFANRWKSIGQGATSARTAPGDTIRVIESPAPVNMGIDATFTQNVSTSTTPTANSNVLILSEAVTIDIDNCDTAWTASTNVTSVSQAAIVQGTNFQQLVVAAGFTTGKAAYRTITQNTYTGYTRVTYWVNQSAGTYAAAGDYSLALCSDTIGAVPVVTMPIPALKNAFWVPVVFDFAGDLPSNINSIALIVNVDRGAVTLNFDNVYACLPASNAKALTGKSLVSRNIGGEEWWMPVRGLSGTTLTVYLVTAQPGWGWTEETQTVALWSRIPIEQTVFETAQTGTTYSNVNEAGSLGSPITYSGGWNESDMSTQSGDTLIDGVYGWGYGMRIGVSYVTTEKLSFMRFDKGISIHAQPVTEVVGVTVNSDGLIRNTTCGLEIYPQSYKIRNCNVTVNNLNGNSGIGYLGSSGTQAVGNCVITLGNVCRNSSSGVAIGQLYGSTLIVDNINENYTGNFTSAGGGRSKITVNKCLNGSRNNAGGTTNLSLTGVSDSTINLGIVDTRYRSQVKTLELNGSMNNKVFIDSFIAKDDGNGSSHGVYLITSVGNVICIASYSGFTNGSSRLLSDNPGCTNTVFVPTYANTNGTGAGRITIPHFGGSVTDHRTYDRFGTIFSDSSIVNTSGSGAISWKLTSNTLATAMSPLTLSLAKVFVQANTATTFSCKVRRSSTSETCGIQICGELVAGIPDNVEALSSVAIDTWDTVSVTVTPTESAVIELCGISYGAAGNAWFDDVTVS